MRVPSTFAIARRKPQQTRASERREQLLAAAAQVIADAGYEPATMTAIAQAAGASIGTLYDYFPDKPALALALLAAYHEEASAYWTMQLDEPCEHTAATLAELMVDGVLRFVKDRPAYLALQGAPVVYRRLPAARLLIRLRFAAAVLKLDPHLSDERAMLTANVCVALIKALVEAYRSAAPRQRPELAGEFRSLLRLYLESL